MKLMRSPLCPLLAGVFFSAGVLLGQGDAPPVDPAQLMQALRALREQQGQQLKVRRANALRDIQSAAASPTAAVAAWEEAVRQVQFEGMTKEGTQFKEWKDREGDALREPEAANAAQLHFRWLALTLQYSMGTTAKELLPQVIAFTKELTADQAANEALGDSIRRDKEQAANGHRPSARKAGSDEAVRRMHDQILRTSVTTGVVAQALKLTDLSKLENWETTPSNVDGIFTRIILPELRTARDPRLIEYWDMKLKREAEKASETKLAFDQERFNQVRRPELLWSRAQDYLVLGQRNRAINEMFTLVKNYPLHPAAGDWMKNLEGLLVPPVPAPAAPSAATPAPVKPAP